MWRNRRIRMNKILTFLILGFLVIPNLGYATSTAAPPPDVKWQALDADGDPYSGGKLYTYETGTSTPKTTWTSSTKGAANANPVVLDSKGAADVWLDSSDGAYRFLLKDSDDNTIWTIDGIYEARPIALDPVWLIDHEADGDHKGYKLVSQFENLTAAQADVGNDYILIIDEDETLSASVTFTKLQEVMFTPGSVITLGAYDLVLFQNLDWGNQQIFDCSGGGVVTGPKYVNVAWYGADAVGDDLQEFQSAIDTISAEGDGSVFIPKCETYYVAAGSVDVESSMRIYGDGPLILGITFDIENDAASTAIQEVHISGLELDGDAGTYATAIHLGSATECTVENMYIYDYSTTGILLDDNNGVLSAFNTIRNIEWDCMVDASSSTADGIKLSGEGNDLRISHNYIENIHGTYDDGDIIELEGLCKNNRIEHITGTLESGGTGYAVHLNDGGTYYPNRNVIGQVEGEVYIDQYAFGNMIGPVDESGGSLELNASNNTENYYSAIDSTTGFLYEVPPYVMRDYLWIGVGDMDILSAAALGTTGGGLWQAYEFADAADQSISFAVPGKRTWGDGDLTYIILYFTGDDNASTESCIMAIDVGCYGDGELITTADHDQNSTIAMNDTANTLEIQNFALSSVAYTEGDIIVGTIMRDGDNGSDNFTGTLELLGVALLFEGDGPSAGSFDIPHTPYLP
jgi:hypothetical protein